MILSPPSIKGSNERSKIIKKKKKVVKYETPYA